MYIYIFIYFLCGHKCFTAGSPEKTHQNTTKSTIIQSSSPSLVHFGISGLWIPPDKTLAGK